ncbi:response regulator [Novosphingobium sp. 9U]|uniref:response regulator n=1 Tax=Novosphingobium sp. 9U TaxID=2653158 RepID=UPI0012F0FBE1|nr:response regulator [Novosphingobium sp. 9U]VWX54902.1 Transcriptional regulator [Novosphingobium sp. 9U]
MNAARVVIVEDEFLVAIQLEDIILDCGHAVVATVPDVASVEALCEAPTVALVDLNLRDGPTGPGIARLLCERYGTRIIYVTANSGQIGEPASTAVGVVHKPFSRAAIEDAIAYALDDTLTVRRPSELQPLGNEALLLRAG